MTKSLEEKLFKHYREEVIDVTFLPISDLHGSCGAERLNIALDRFKSVPIIAM